VETRATCTGVIIAFAWAGHGLGGVVGGYLYDMTATYDLTFAVAALAGVVNLAIIGSLGLWLVRDRIKTLTMRPLPTAQDETYVALK